MNIRLTITDDHPLVRNGLVNVLNNVEGMEVVAAYGSGKELLDGIAKLQPDILLLDMQLPDLQGPYLAQTILDKYSQVKIIVISSFDVIVQVKKMLKMGCLGYLLKDADETTIIEAIQTVHNGGQYLSARLTQEIVQDSFKNKRQQKLVLSRREKEVLQLIVQEHTNQEIADKLFLSLHTVENHRISLLHKLNVKNTAGLVREAVENGLV